MQKKIFFIILPSLAGGGAEKVILTFFKNINTDLFEPILIVQNKIGPLHVDKSKGKIIFLNYSKFIYAIPKLLLLILRFKPKLIFSTFPHITIYLLIFKKLFFKKILLIARIPNMLKPSIENNSFSRLFEFLHRILMPYCDKIIVTSKAMRNDFIKSGIEENKCLIIRNPIDSVNLRNIEKLERFPGKGLRLVFVGRIVHQKGLDRIIPIIKNIKNCHITMIGDGNQKEFLKNIYNNEDLNKKVKFIDYSYNANAYIAGADYFLLPSRWEGLPNVALESLILGTPVITFKEIIGLKDLISIVEKNKLFLCKDENDMEILISKLQIRKDFLKPVLRKSLIKQFNTPMTYANKIEKIMKDLIH